MLPQVVISVALLLVTAVAMYFLGKFVPLLPKVVGVFTLLWFLGLFFGLQGFTQLTDLLKQLPAYTYLLTFSIGSTIGGMVADLF